MNHPLPPGTRVVANIVACATCNLDVENHVKTRIQSVNETDEGIVYTLISQHKVSPSDIIEVAEDDLETPT